MKTCLIAGWRFRIRCSRRATAAVRSGAGSPAANATSIVKSTVCGPKYIVRRFFTSLTAGSASARSTDAVQRLSAGTLSDQQPFALESQESGDAHEDDANHQRRRTVKIGIVEPMTQVDAPKGDQESGERGGVLEGHDKGRRVLGGPDLFPRAPGSLDFPKRPESDPEDDAFKDRRDPPARRSSMSDPPAAGDPSSAGCLRRLRRLRPRRR